MQHTAAHASTDTGLLGKLLINAQQQLEESWILQKKVGHWRGLEVW